MASLPPLTTFRALSFDIYGTLIDWESGIYIILKHLTSRLPPSHPCKDSQDATIAAFDKHEICIITTNPSMLYEKALAKAYIALADEWGVEVKPGEPEQVGESIKDWQPFPDTIAAMQALGKRYKLVALSNISKSAFAKTTSGPLKDVKFDAIYVAEEIGSYKPDKRNFEYLLNGVEREFGVTKKQLLHVAHGVPSDQIPAEEMGIGHAWIRRGKDNWGEREKTSGLKWWETLGDMAGSVEDDFAGHS